MFSRIMYVTVFVSDQDKALSALMAHSVGLSTYLRRRFINGYNWFLLPSYWGSSERASADGTKWDLYEQNLLSEYHCQPGRRSVNGR
jgi:hypothetical protein